MPFKKPAETQQHKSQLFLFRMWLEDLGNGNTDWRGKIQHVSSGEALYIRDWSEVETFVNRMLYPENKDG